MATKKKNPRKPTAPTEQLAYKIIFLALQPGPLRFSKQAKIAKLLQLALDEACEEGRKAGAQKQAELATAVLATLVDDGDTETPITLSGPTVRMLLNQETGAHKYYAKMIYEMPISADTQSDALERLEARIVTTDGATVSTEIERVCDCEEDEEADDGNE
jgi:hypothetical protein